MAVPLSSFARTFLINGPAARAAWVHPLLMWTTEAQASARQNHSTTVVVGRGSAPKADDPLILEVSKQPQNKSAFGFGVSLGRIQNNDLVVDDASVSRFHAYFQLTPADGKWAVVDADSSNGTWVNGTRLTAGQPHTLSSGAVLRFGAVQMSFYLPQGFIDHLRKMVQSK